MKKRVLSLTLAAVMTCSLCACGAKAKTDDKYANVIRQLENENYEGAKHEIDKLERKALEASQKKVDNGEDEIVRNENDGVVELSIAQFLKYAEKVTITQDNWKDYFEDRKEEYHEEDINTFGEVTNVREGTRYVFGVKNTHNVAAVKNVGFKFTGKKELREQYNSDGTVTPIVYEFLKNQKAKKYDMDGKLIGEDEYSEVETDDFYVELPYDVKATGAIYTDYECTNATGELIIANIPDDLWTTTEWAEEGVIYIKTDKYNFISIRKDSIPNFDELNKLFPE